MTDSQGMNDERLPLEMSVTVGRGSAPEAHDLEMSVFDRVVIPVQIEIPMTPELREAIARARGGDAGRRQTSMPVRLGKEWTTAPSQPGQAVAGAVSARMGDTPPRPDLSGGAAAGPSGTDGRDATPRRPGSPISSRWPWAGSTGLRLALLGDRMAPATPYGGRGGGEVGVLTPRTSEPLRSAGLRTPDGAPIVLAQDEELAGPAVEAGRQLYRELQAEFAELDQLDAEMGVEDLTRPQRVAITRSENIIRDHALQKDFTGVAKEQQGLLPDDGHIKEMKASLRGIQDTIDSLTGSLKNPYLDQETKTTLEFYLGRAESTAHAYKKALGVKP